MEKHQVELFRAIRSGDVAKARKAYDKGADVNWPLDRWMEHGHQHWGLRVRGVGVLGFRRRWDSWILDVRLLGSIDGGAAFIRDAAAVAAVVSCCDCYLHSLVSYYQVGAQKSHNAPIVRN